MIHFRVARKSCSRHMRLAIGRLAATTDSIIFAFIHAVIIYQSFANHFDIF